MSRLEFKFDWIPPQGARGDELRATWAQLEIRVGDSVVTSLIDEASRSIRRGPFLPLYPLAEWIAANWWALWSESVSGAREGEGGFSRRHSIKFAGEGFALPDFSIVPIGGEVRLRWGALAIPLTRVTFVAEGEEFVPLEDVRSALFELVGAVVNRLEEEGVRSSPLQEDWSAIVSASEGQEEFCALVGGLGLDPFDQPEEEAERIVAVANGLPSQLREELFVATTPTTFAEDAGLLNASVKRAIGSKADAPVFRDIAKRLASTSPIHDLPWAQGQQLARTARSHLGLNGQPLSDDFALGKAFGLDKAGWESLFLPGTSHVFDAVVGVNAKGTPSFVMRERVPTGRRFAVCRAIGEFFAAPHQDSCLISVARTLRQQRSRAFAAEFLAPASSLEKRVSGRRISGDEADEIAQEFGVATIVIAHQLENNRIARVVGD